MVQCRNKRLNQEGCRKQSNAECIPGITWSKESRLLRKQLLQLVLAEQDLVDGVSSVLEGYVVTVDVGGEEDFCRANC